MTVADPVFILGHTRTPVCSFLGGLSTIPAPVLGGEVVKQLLAVTQISPERVDSLFLGNVFSAGLGQNPAKQCSRFGGLTDDCTCVTVNQVCSSSMRAVILSCQALRMRDTSVSIVIGSENMSLAPRLVRNTRQVQKVGLLKFDNPVDSEDVLITDGLRDSIVGRHMAELADTAVVTHGFTRTQLDEYSIESLKRAHAASDAGVLTIF
jgi:acetyl-CoA C-acetyltransferase